MKKLKNLIRFVSFLLVLVLGMSFFSNTLMASDTDNSISRSRVEQSINAEEVNTLDVIFLGDSTISNSIIPIRIWEDHKITSYNIGYGWAYPNEIFYELERIMLTQKPKYVFLESSYFIDTIDKSIDDDGYNLKAIKFIDNELLGKFNYVFPYIRYKSVIKDRTLKEILSVKPKCINNVYKGYNLKIENEAVNESFTDSTTGKKAIYVESGKEYFDKIYKLCKKNNCKLVILLSPQINDWTQEEHNLLCSLAKEYDVPFLDLNIDTEETIKGFSWNTDSADGGTHLNFSGATKTTKAIGDYLVNELGMKPTELTKEQAEKWDNDTKLFYEAIKENN